MIKRFKIKTQKGVTLIELLSAVLLFALVIGVIYSMLNFANNQLSYSGRRAEAQAQLRHIMQLLKKEAGTARGITIITGSSGTGSDIICYVKRETVNGKTMGTFMLHRLNESPKAGDGCVAVEGLSIQFSAEPGSQVLHVKITAANGVTLESDIFGQNLPAEGITGTSGDAIICVPVTSS